MAGLPFAVSAGPACVAPTAADARSPAGAHEVIELLSSSDSDEASSGEPEPRRRAPRSPSSSEEEKQQLKPPRRRLVRSSHGTKVGNGRRRKRLAPSESENSQESASSDEEREILEQLNRRSHAPAPKKAKVAPTKAYVAPERRPRHDPRAEGEMRQITEGMSFYELQAQEQMMARFQAQNRRKAPSKLRTEQRSEQRSEKPQVSSEVPKRATQESRQSKDNMSVNEMLAQGRAMTQFHMQKARKSAPSAGKSYASESESEENEKSDDEWEAFEKKSAQRELQRKQNQRTTNAPMEKKHKATHKTSASRESNGVRKLTGKQQTARKMVVAKKAGPQGYGKENPVLKPSKTKKRVLPLKPQSSSSEEESEEKNEEKSDEDSDEVEFSTELPPRHQDQASSPKDAIPKRSDALPPSKSQPKETRPLQVNPPRTTENIAEKMSFRELQEQEEALAFFHAQKRRSTSTARKGGRGTNGVNGTNDAQNKTNYDGRRARMGVNQKDTSDTSSSLSYLAPPSRNGFLAPSAQFVSVAGCAATPPEKPSNPVIHSTAWRRLVFDEAPPNILHAVSAIPYAYDHQSWLEVSPIERTTARRVLQNPTHTLHPYNYLVGDVRYFVHQDQTAFESMVYPETVTHLPNDITAIRRFFTMIGVRKNVFVDEDPILRYVPYFGDGENMVIDNELYMATTMSKERRIAVLREGDDLKVLNPGARDDEIMECLLRVIVRECGASEEVFLALQREAGFDRPRIDYCEMQKDAKRELRAAQQIARLRRMIDLSEDSTAQDTSKTKSSKELRKLAQTYWFLQDKAKVQSLTVRLQPPLTGFESNYVDSAEGLGIRECSTYEGLVEGHRDLFCRRCYSYDCHEHGTQNPHRSHRADPINPMINVPAIMVARQEVSNQEKESNTERGSQTSTVEHSEVIELTGSLSSNDEANEHKSEQADEPAPNPQPAYRRSRRAQTRISSLATKSLVTQEKMLESERLAEVEKRRKRREKFERADDNSEYLDNSYFPAVTTTLKQLLSKTNECSTSCWLSVSRNEPREDHTPLSQVDSVLVRKLASTFGPNACVVSAVLKSPRCTCAQIYRFLAEEKIRRNSGDNLGREHDPPMQIEMRRKSRRGGVGSNRAKRTHEQRSDREKKLSYVPCDHDGVCGEKCDCTLRGHSCSKACSCPRDCPNRFQGCKCSTGYCHTSACPCWSVGRECDPDYCFNCGASDAAVMAFLPDYKSISSYDLNICFNVNMLRGSIQKKIGVAASATHGWGAYALEPIRKDEFVLEYTGELIEDREAERRGAIYDRKAVSYLFGVNSDYVVDAARMGNKAKFANHRAKEVANLDVRIISSNGEDRIGLFARESIEVGAELFFDYGYTHDSAPKWSQHDKPEPEKRVYDIVDDENEWDVPSQVIKHTVQTSTTSDSIAIANVLCWKSMSACRSQTRHLLDPSTIHQRTNECITAPYIYSQRSRDLASGSSVGTFGTKVAISFLRAFTSDVSFSTISIAFRFSSSCDGRLAPTITVDTFSLEMIQAFARAGFFRAISRLSLILGFFFMSWARAGFFLRH
ncbi:unnamed protein product [Phytophthora lilii]|uniref:Unnamed protein product n=1 Tax=Phytophthora lilii TaxID=2077276 RepID=A0A9W6U786_9STRA|nr:unnamed protein product [Phytophthora lilii]